MHAETLSYDLRIMTGNKENGGRTKMSNQARNTPWILWPFVAIRDLLTGILKLTGRVVAALIGIVLMITGIALSLTIVGAIIGIPLIIFGFMLTVRGLY